MKFYCLINPFAGGRKGAALLETLRALKEEGGYDGEVHELSLRDIQQQLDDALKFDRLLVAGGDGTISFVLDALGERNLPVGLLPLGTANDLARELGIWRDFSLQNPEKLLRIYSECPAIPVSLWRLQYGVQPEDSQIFVNYVSFGFDAKVVNLFSAWRKSKRYILARFGVIGNRICYVAASLASLCTTVNLRKVICVKNGEQYQLPVSRCRTLLFANTQSIMGLGRSNRVGSVSDQVIEFIIPQFLIHYFSMLLKLPPGLPKPHFCGESLKWEITESEGRPIPVQIDGESREDIISSTYTVTFERFVPVLSKGSGTNK